MLLVHCIHQARLITYNVTQTSYYEKLVRTRMRSIDGCYFHWPWVTPSQRPKPPHFVLPFISSLRKAI